MHKPKPINELLRSGGKRLGALQALSAARSATLEHVCAALPAAWADTVVSAGIDGGRLTIGVTGAAWATRLRYVTEMLRTQVGSRLGVEIQRVRIKVVRPRA